MSQNQNGKVPFVDLVTMHQQLAPELVEVFKTVLNTAGFIGGPMLDNFEKAFAEFCDAKICVGVSSGTDALRFALMAAGVNTGDIVITVPLTFVATTEAISQAGAIPDFVDVDARTYTMDPQKLRQYLEHECITKTGDQRPVHRKSGRTVSAVIPVHLYGQVADVEDPIIDLAARYNLIVIEDACQAHGAKYFSQNQNRWMTAGSIGHAAAFSFYPGKNLGACGEAGAVTTADPTIAEKIRVLRDHGSAKKYHHDVEGYNGRLDSLQAGILNVKLKHLAHWNEQRRECAARYQAALAPLSAVIVPPFEPAHSKSVYHLYVVRTADRERLQKHLTEAGIGTGIHYPIPVHLQRAYQWMNLKVGDFPISERVASEILSLPMFAGLTPEQQDQVTESVAEFASVHGCMIPPTRATPFWTELVSESESSVFGR